MDMHAASYELFTYRTALPRVLGMCARCLPVCTQEASTAGGKKDDNGSKEGKPLGM